MCKPTHKVAALTAGVFLLATVAQAQRGSFTVGTATAAPGQKATGFLEVPAGMDAATSIPVAVVQGGKPGPVLALVSGSHGTEYASIIAVEKLIQSVNPAEVSGTVILLPLVNIPSFLQKVPHVNPVDNKSMNRFYPGKADGTQTERASFLITKQIVERCDYLIDYHGGDLDENLRAYSYWSRTGNEKQDAVTHDMVLAFGLDHIIIVTDRPADPNASRYLDSTASTRGKPAIAVEAGHSGTVEPEDVDALANGTLNVMRYLKMLPGAAPMVQHPVWIAKINRMTSEREGIFYPVVARGSYAEQGMKVGYVTDYFGNTIFEARAPVAGVVLYICSVPSMKKDDTIAYIGEVAAKAP
ncbi:MAG TPA: succinylglutamate desuccinylase/aspartoacylase family protein [Candidatus Acidoferrales bacterium]|nr:succinylglutamate desuccinylase/aspartoacylase family protein [Candidatus Acidoferrales bacterium]